MLRDYRNPPYRTQGFQTKGSFLWTFCACGNCCFFCIVFLFFPGGGLVLCSRREDKRKEGRIIIIPSITLRTIITSILSTLITLAFFAFS